MAYGYNIIRRHSGINYGKVLSWEELPGVFSSEGRDVTCVSSAKHSGRLYLDLVGLGVMEYCFSWSFQGMVIFKLVEKLSRAPFGNRPGKLHSIP